MSKTDADKDRRLAKLNGLLEKLKAGKHVQNRDLQTWLTPDEFTAMQSAWEDEKAGRIKASDKPYEVTDYEELLRLAILEDNKANGYVASGNQAKINRARYKSQQLIERLYEYLQEITHKDPTLQYWFDRNVLWDPEDSPGLDLISVPRVITSRSLDNLTKGGRHLKQSISDIKITAVKSAIEAMKKDPEEVARNEEKLKEMLGKLKVRR